ncbi:MAG: alpha-L-fucosidase [Mongoliibacter sp.]|uniref:alpha-L-fucosidase n=1 Tax=Mongoliibacter sp. TaxID=2022438 RepID=UPI0012F16BEC|nr:alpha-L-fucosidase [Mongoliibacter sp.]TVP52832.1 MAG: alpha-L-fucosidase [Mongoliibacter sp.]
MRCNILRSFFFLSLFPILSLQVFGQKDYQPSEENLKNREWFQDNKYGLFVHWGVYSVMAGGGDMGIAEWIMNQKQIPIVAYENLPNYFNPIAFDAEEWVAIVKKAGMRYITITSKHHDGFAMYDSKVSDYNIVQKTPFKRDVLKELKDACDKEGIKLFFYYSQLDWHHPDYYPRGSTGKGYTGRPDSGEWRKYIDYMKDQLTELLTNYGEIGGIWFDGQWDKYEENWYLDEIYSHIHSLQPGALIGSNHHLAPFPGEDFQMFERDLPGENTMGFNKGAEISRELPLEMCETMNGSWGYNIKDRRFKSSEQLLETMIRAAGYGANFLLNTGPLPNGKIQSENIDTLMLMSKWLDKYGETIYGTRKGPIDPRPWGVTTQKDNKVFVHLLAWKDQSILIPNIDKKVKSAKLLSDMSNIKFSESKEGIILTIPYEKRKPLETIIVLEF